MRSMRALALLIVLSCLNGCGRLRVDSTWVQPIRLHPETIEWLAERQSDWPDTLVIDLNLLDKHNQKCREILGVE